MAQAGKWIRVQYDNSSDALQNITAHVMELTINGLTFDEIESSGFTQDHNYTLGQGDCTINMTLKFNSTTTGLFTHATTGSAGSNTARDFLAAFGNNAAVAGGEPEISGDFVCSSAVPVVAKDGLQQLQVVLKVGPDATLPAWGTAS